MERNRFGKHDMRRRHPLDGQNQVDHSPEGVSGRDAGPGRHRHHAERSARPWADAEEGQSHARGGREVFHPEADYDEDNLAFIPNSYGGRYERRDMMQHRMDAQSGDYGSHRSWHAWERNPSGIAERQDERPRGGQRGKGPKGYQPSDERLKERLQEAFYDDDELDASEIEILVQGGEVTLQGAVAEREDRQRAEWLVERVAGHRVHVNNNLRVQGH
ncbi:MAG: BON domain-containing protein [Pseudomonadota bacterium]|uniref:BON domain-containing protein n=1 Tax=Thermithiobacillus tepidarius TaxID=929 RepID=UPI0003FD98CE|nr:BON domain-containing protein [Thermithiobacillus tepidarius]